MSHLTLLVGSTLGATEYVADRLSELLTAAGHNSTIVSRFDQWQASDAPSDLWLICTSTHGAGDLPDNIQPLGQYLASKRPDLRHHRFAVVAVGDSSYDTFCEGGKTLERLLEDCGAVNLLPRLEIDVQDHPIPEDEAERWLPQLLAHI